MNVIGLERKMAKRTIANVAILTLASLFTYAAAEPAKAADNGITETTHPAFFRASNANSPSTQPALDDLNSPEAIVAYAKAMEARLRRERLVLRALIDKLPKRLIAEANEKAKTFDGKTLLDRKTYERVLYFVPKPKPRPQDPNAPFFMPYTVLTIKHPRGIDGPPKPPAGAVERRWKDHFALAQQFSYRYSYGGIKKLLRKQDMDKPFEAEFEIKIKGTFRVGIASDLGDPPKTPEDMNLWKPFYPRTRFFSWGGDMDPLWSPGMPGDANATPTNELERKAVATMKTAPVKTFESTCVYRIVFDLPKGKWGYIYFNRNENWPSPKSLNWKMGIPEELQGIVYTPAEAKAAATRPATTQPAKKGR